MNAATDPYVMPSWTTGGTDVICEKETVKEWRESARDGGKESGGDRERERDREGGRGREMQ